MRVARPTIRVKRAGQPLILASGDSLLHLHSQILLTTLPPSQRPRLVVDCHVCVPAATHRYDSRTFSFGFLPTAIPYRYWQRTVEQMILTVAGHDALALTFDLGDLVLNFSAYTHASLFGFPSSPDHVLFLSAVIEVATDRTHRRFFYYPFPGAEMQVFQDGVVSANRYDGGAPASASPIQSSIKRVVYGGEAAAEGDRDRSCAICLEEYEEAAVLDELMCGHEFHPYCIGKWLRNRPTCPLCRMQVPVDQE